MTLKNTAAARAFATLLASTVMAGMTPLATAQTASGATGASTSTAGDPSPYYIGAGEALSHDSNVYRVPGGVGDNYSSTSLRAGFDQPISRQRVFGAAVVTLNRYQDQTALNNTSYALSGGANWETIEHLSGDLNASLGRSLSAPTVSSAASAAVRNVAHTRSVDAVARWGGISLLTLQGNAGWSRVNYSASESAAGDSRQGRAGLGLYYRPGGPLTLGVAGRFFRTDAPNAIVDPSGSTRSNTLDSRNIDAIAAYELTGLVSASGRISYSRQTSSDIAGQDFSGLTGGVALDWRPTQKTSVRLDAARDAGTNNALYSVTPVAVPTSPPATGGTTTPTTGTTGTTGTPAFALYENNQITDSVGVSISNAASAKIALSANGRYGRARLAVGSFQNGGTPASANSTDTSKLLGLGATYEITRYWNAACNLSREWRSISGVIGFSYTASTVSCSTQLTLR